VVPTLVEALREEAARYSAVLFFTYLYYPTYWGLKAAPERSILVPTTHDEPPLRFGIFREVFEAPRAFAFLTSAEADLVSDRFAIGDRPTAVTGIGIEAPASTDPDRFKTKHDVLSPYLLYAGRIDAGKGCDELLDCYERYRRDVRGAAQLLLIGRLAMPEPRVPGVRYLGYLSEQEKLDAMAGATAVVCPSPYESLSITLLEALGLGTPVIASSRSPVLVDHCRRSGAGLFFEDAAEFAESVELIGKSPRLASRLGAAGRRYVDREYRWDVVLGRYRALIDAAGDS
jgi:glycosyltransferase involved in cell wall biosynthesis